MNLKLQNTHIKTMAPKDTIAAIATAPGRGGVGIIRLSGSKARALAKTITGQTTLKPRYAHYGDFYHPAEQQIIDQGIALFFEGSASFTGEDVLELQGHGGPIILDQLLKAVINEEGVRLAAPGEFSERAYLNDKMDLTQAEAIADLIDASSEQAAKNALNSLQGVFSDKIHTLVESLTHLRIYVEAAIDFPEEEVDFLSDKTISEGIDHIQQSLNMIFAEAKQGAIIREGMTVVIAGRPNAGKSSLLNALAGKESAIVTDIAGTTRDVLREHIHLDGMPLHIIDTAGLRNSGDQVEKIGMQRAWAEIEKADRILVLADTQEILKNMPKTLSLNDLLPPENNQQFELNPKKISVVFNKIDLIKNSQTLPSIDNIDATSTLRLSAKQGVGVDALTEHLKAIMGYQQTGEGGFTARRRHLEALEATLHSVENAVQQLNTGAGELVAEDLRQAQQHLGEITGQVSADDLLGKIFSSFCIGK